jgi:Winged helix DNA-binding domain
MFILGGSALLIGYRQAPQRAAARHQRVTGGSPIVRAGLAAGLPVQAVAGLRLALETGRGRPGMPARSVLTGAVLAVLVGTATLTFGASLARLVSRPALYGWDFSYALYSTDGWGPFPPSRVVCALPILYGYRLVGKLDAEADRRAGMLRINAIHQDVAFTRAVTTAIDREIRSLAQWFRPHIEIA